MALRLRRGTDAERQLITPAEGELVYTTDTKSVYIGDGTTAGGIIITGEFSLGDLSEVDLSTPPTIGQTLVWDGLKFVPNTIEGTTSASIFDLNDVFAFTSPDVGDILQFDGVNFVSQKIQRIEGSDSSIMLDTATNTFTGVFVGDGSQLTNLPISGGGTTISSIFDLNDVFTDGSLLGTGDILRWDGLNFTPAPISEVFQEQQNYKINIVGDDSTILVDTDTNTFTGVFVGDGSQLTNLPISGGTTISSIFDLNDVFALEGFVPDAGDVLQYDGANFVSQKIVRIEGSDSTIMLDTSTNTFTGVFVGDGSGLTNVPSSSFSGSIFDLNDVFALEGFVPDAGDMLIFDGASFVAQKIRRIEGDDSTVMLNTATNTFTGNFIGDLDGNVIGNLTGDITGDVIGNVFGNVVGTLDGTVVGNVIGTLEGDVIGSVFTDNSELVIDGQFGDIYPREIRTNTFLRIASNTSNQIGFVQMESQDEFTSLSLIRKSDSDLTGLNNRYGQLRFGRDDANGLTLTTVISANEDFVWIFNGSDGVISEAKILTNANGDIGIGTATPNEKLDVRGNTVVSGFVQFGSLTTTERNALTAAAGMVIWNSTTIQFEGFNGTNWINLVDGTISA